MVKRCCCMYVIGLIMIMLIPMVPIEPPAEEEPIMVNEPTFSVLTGTNDDLEDLQSFRNLAYYNGIYYWGGISGNNLILYKCTGLNGATSTVDTYDVTTDAACDDLTTVIGIVCKYIYDSDTATNYIVTFVMYNDTTSGNSFSAILSYDPVGLTSNAGIDLILGTDTITGSALDIYYDTVVSDIVIVLYWEDVGTPTHSIEGTRWDHTTGVGVPTLSWITTGNGTILTNSDAVWAGWADSQNETYNFVIRDATTRLITMEYGEGRNDTPTSETLSITPPSVYNADIQLYWKQGNLEIIMDRDHLYTRLNKGEWVNYVDAGTTTNGIIWGLDANNKLIIKYIVWKDSFYEVLTGGSLVKIMVFTDSAYVGWENWISNGVDKIYQLEYIWTGIVRGDVRNRVMNYPTAQIESSVKPFTDKWLKLYNDSDELEYQGRVLKDKNDGSKYILTTVSGIEDDFKIKITETFTTKTIHYIVKFIVDKYFGYIWYGTLIATTNATTFNKTFKSAGFEEVLKWAAQYGGFIGSFLPTYELRLNAFIASGETIADNVTTYGYEEILYESFHEKFSLIRLYGGYVAGVQLESVAWGEPNQGYWQDTFAHITVQAELDAMATQILTNRNVEIIAATFTIAGKNRLNPGDSFTYTSIKRGVTAETWYFIRNDIDIRNGTQVIYATDSFWIPNPTKDEVQSNRITQTEQNIGAIAEDVSANYKLNRKIAFRVWRSAARSVLTATPTNISFDTEIYDEGSTFASGKFTAPVDGIYQFSAGCMFNDHAWADGEVAYLALFINGTQELTLARFECQSPESMFVQMGGSSDLKLSATDYVEVYAYQSSGATLTLYTTNKHYTWFTGHWVMDV